VYAGLHFERLSLKKYINYFKLGLNRHVIITNFHDFSKTFMIYVFSMTFPGLEMTIFKLHDFSRFSMTVQTLYRALSGWLAVSCSAYHTFRAFSGRLRLTFPHWRHFPVWRLRWTQWCRTTLDWNTTSGSLEFHMKTLLISWCPPSHGDEPQSSRCPWHYSVWRCEATLQQATLLSSGLHHSPHNYTLSLGWACDSNRFLNYQWMI